MNFDLVPIPFPEANKTGFGRPLTVAEKMNVKVTDGQIMDIPFYSKGSKRITVWYCGSWIARIVFLFTGKLTMMELGGITPKGLVVGKMQIVETTTNNEEKQP